MPDNYEVYIVNTEIKNEDCALSAISKVLQRGDKRRCFALTDPSSSEQISKWENDPNVTVLEVVDIYPPSDTLRMRAFIEKIGQPIRRYVCLLRFEGSYTIEGLKYFWFNMGIFFGHVIYVGKDNSFPHGGNMLKLLWSSCRKIQDMAKLYLMIGAYLVLVSLIVSLATDT